MKVKRVNVVMLAGAMRASSLRQELGMPLFSLPLAPGMSLLGCWLDAFESVAETVRLRLVVNGAADVRAMDQLVARHVRLNASELQVHVVPDPAPWRGTGGLIRDVSELFDGDEAIIVVEASCTPPRDFGLIAAAQHDEIGSIGTSVEFEPAGVYAFTRDMLQTIPGEGYCDLKEQIVPSLHDAGYRLRPVVVTDRVRRLRDSASYLRAVESFHLNQGSEAPDEANVSATARLGGYCLIDAGARIEDRAVVHNSVIMTGAVVRAGAVVSRAIVGRDAIVEAEQIVRDSVLPAADHLMPHSPARVGAGQRRSLLIGQG